MTHIYDSFNFAYSILFHKWTSFFTTYVSSTNQLNVDARSDNKFFRSDLSQNSILTLWWHQVEQLSILIFRFSFGLSNSISIPSLITPIRSESMIVFNRWANCDIEYYSNIVNIVNSITSTMKYLIKSILWSQILK